MALKAGPGPIVAIEVEALRKDLHLVSAALQTDRMIVTQDTKARDLFGRAAAGRTELNRLTWMNPQEPDCLLRLRGSRRRRSPA